MLPLFAIYYVYDFPLHLRWFLWIPLGSAIYLFGIPDMGLLLFALGMYIFFTVFFWGNFILSSAHWNDLVELFAHLEAIFEEYGFYERQRVRAIA